MVGNWLLSAARVFTQESLLSAPLMAAVCWTANSVHLSPQPAITTTLNTHILYHSLACFLQLFCSVWLSILTLLPPWLFLTYTHTFPGESSGARENKALITSHCTTNRYLDFNL